MLILCGLIIIVIILVIYIGIIRVKETFVLIDVLSQQDYDGLVVVSSHYQEDIEWLKNANARAVVCSKTLASPLCEHTNQNKGREATSYLKFIIDNYDALPKHVAFIHGHQNAWHHQLKTNRGEDILHVVQHCAKYQEYGFVSLNNCQIDDRNNANAIMMYMRDVFWDPVFRPYLNRDMPNYVFHDCCAQFIVSRDRILRLPRAAYAHWFNYCMHEDPTNDGGFKLSIAFEYIWHIIFGEPDVVRQDEQRKMFKESCSANV